MRKPFIPTLLASKEKAQQRMDVCNGCEHRTMHSVMKTQPACAVCKCPLVSKTRIKSSSCPLHKW